MNDERGSSDVPAPGTSGAGGAVSPRASDADRERTIAVLRDATVEGRLTLDEFSERVERALQARTHEELLELGADLPRAVEVVPSAQKKAGRWVVASQLERRGRWRLSDGYRLSAVCATVVLDLGQAMVEGNVTTLELRNLFSTVTILVPDAIQVEIDDGGVFLTTEVKLPEQRTSDSAPLIRIRTSGIGGTNYICHPPVPAST
jgi:hypothetical protein